MATILIIVIILALIFDFLNGVHDSSNVVATMISSRALSPRVALWMTAAANFVGPFIFGVAVILSATTSVTSGGKAGKRTRQVVNMQLICQLSMMVIKDRWVPV